jgi:hypothetical protein
MLKLIRSAALVLMLIPSIVQAQSIDKGFAAIKADDYATALKEWLPLADQESRELHHKIGQIYYFGGNGVLQNYTEARKWFLRAAEAGHVDAQFYLGLTYAQGAPQDYVLAHMWVNIANAKRQKDASSYLGRLEPKMTADEIALAQELAIRCRDYAYTSEYCNRGDPPPAVPALSEKQPSIPNLARKPQAKPADLGLSSLTPKDSPQASDGNSLKTTDPTALSKVDPSAQADADALAVALAEATGGAQHVAEALPMTYLEIEGLSSAINKCLNTGTLSTDALNTTVEVQFEMSEDAKPNVQSIKMMSFSGDSIAAAQIAFQVARKAIVLCGQKGYGLDPAKYGQWAVLNVAFDQNGMRLR